MITANADFLENFWANFSADLIVGIFLTSLIAWIVRRRQRVDLTMGTTLRVTEDGGTRAFFSIENRGNVVMRKDDVHFHVFVREGQIPLKILNKLTCRRVKYLSGTYVEITGTLNTSVFPSNATWVEDIEVRGTDFELHDFLYYLSTASGIFPRRSKIDRATHKISGLASMSWFHVFPKDGEAKVIKPSQKLGEIIAAGKAKVLPSDSIQSGMTSWLRRLWPRRRQAQFILMDVEEDSTIDELKKYEVWITGDVFIQNGQLMFRTDKPVQGNTTGNVVLLGSTKEQANFLLPAYSKAADKHMKLRLYGLLVPDPNAKDPTLPSVSFITWKVHLPTDPDDLPNNQKIIIGPEDKIPGYEVEVKQQKP